MTRYFINTEDMPEEAPAPFSTAAPASSAETIRPQESRLTLSDPIVQTRSRSTRRGLATAAVLICLLVVAMLGAALLKALVQQHRQIRVSQNNLQSFWLADSAARRAVHQLSQAPAYQGETWNVPADVIGSNGSVLIEVSQATTPEHGNQIRVTATYPDSNVFRVVSRREAFLPTPVSSSDKGSNNTEEQKKKEGGDGESEEVDSTDSI